MKRTQVLCGQHIGRMIRFNWSIRGNIKVTPTTAETILKSYGYEVVDVLEFLNLQKKEKLDFTGKHNERLSKYESHIDYKTEPCFIYKDNDVLIDGLEQAKALTNTVEIMEGLPTTVVEKEEKVNISDEDHSEIMKKVKLCCMFEATQKKLPKRKDPLRPSWVFKREYGIINSRKNDLLCKNLVTVCEQCSENNINKSVILDAFFSTPFEAHKKKIQFETSGLVISSTKKLKVITEPSVTHGFSLPNLHPMDCTTGLNPYNIYVMQDIFPPGVNSKWPYVQTAIFHFNHSEVKNITEEEVTESQIQGYSLLKGFTVAGAEARAFFGHDVKELPEPIVVPIVQTDGKMFHFTIFQLNTLDLDKNLGIKNIFWNSQRIPLYEVCEYQAGRPVLQGYNPDVIRKLMTFYNIE